MTADGTATDPAHPQTRAAPVPAQVARVPLPPPTRIVRQVEAIDAWVAARREREQALRAPRLTRDEQMDATREVEALRRTHDTIKGRCARGLDAEIEPMSSCVPTAIIAHRHAWLVDKLALLLGGHGVSVLVCTDNGAEALGAIVAEQPDIVLVGDRLGMIPGRMLLTETRQYAPSTLLAAQASDPAEADGLRAIADTVFLRHHPPAVVADTLVALHRSITGESSRA